MKTSVQTHQWKRAEIFAGVWMAFAVVTSFSYGQGYQDFLGTGAVWKLKSDFPQPDKNLQYMISEAKAMQVSPGQLTAKTGDGVEAKFSIVPPPPTLVVGQEYKASLTGVSTSHSGPPHKIPYARMSLSQECISKIAGKKNGETTYQRVNEYSSVVVYPPPFRADMAGPENQLRTGEHSDELSFIFQPDSDSVRDRAFSFYVSPNIGQSGVCLYVYTYEPYQPAPLAGTGPVTGSVTGTGSGRGTGGVPPIPPKTDLNTLLLQALAVLLGGGLAWMFPSLIHSLLNALHGAGGQSAASPFIDKTGEPYWDEDLPIPPKPIGLGTTNNLRYDADGNLDLADPATLDTAIRMAHHHIYINHGSAGMYPPELQALADGLFAAFGEPSALTAWPDALFNPDPPIVTTSGPYATNYLRNVVGLQTVDVVITDPSGATRIEPRLAAPDGVPPNVTSLGFDRRVMTDKLGRAVHVIDPPDSVVVSFPDKVNVPVVQTRVSDNGNLGTWLYRQGITPQVVTDTLPDGTPVSGIRVPDHWPGNVRGWNFSTITLSNGQQVFDVARGVSISAT